MVYSFREGLFFRNFADAKFRENKTLTKISELTVVNFLTIDISSANMHQRSKTNDYTVILVAARDSFILMAPIFFTRVCIKMQGNVPLRIPSKGIVSACASKTSMIAIAFLCNVFLFVVVVATSKQSGPAWSQKGVGLNLDRS